METYIVMVTYPNQGQGFEDRDFDKATPGAEEVEKAFEAVGGKLLHSWSTLGSFDALAVVEVPDANALMAANSSFPVKTESIRAFDANDEAGLSLLVEYSKKIQAVRKG